MTRYQLYCTALVALAVLANATTCLWDSDMQFESCEESLIERDSIPALELLQRGLQFQQIGSSAFTAAPAKTKGGLRSATNESVRRLELCPHWMDAMREISYWGEAPLFSFKAVLSSSSTLRFPTKRRSWKFNVGAHARVRKPSGAQITCVVTQIVERSAEVRCSDGGTRAQEECSLRLWGDYDIGDDRPWTGEFWASAPWSDWLVLLATCVVLCIFDFSILCRLPKNMGWVIATVVTWIILAVAYNCFVWVIDDNTLAIEWATGYLLEWMLSLDNLMVFHLVFNIYKTPPDQMHTALFVGIAGAVIIRMLFFMVASDLLSVFSWLKWPVAVLLIWSGVSAAISGDDDETDVADLKLMRALKWCLGSRIAEGYEASGAVFTCDENGRVQVTLLFVVIISIELIDVVFALDCVTAKVALIPDLYVAFSSTVLAMFGSRAMFFIIEHLVRMFDLLKYGLCIILVLIGLELAVSTWVDFSSSVVCILIFSVFFLCIVASWLKNRIVGAENALETTKETPKNVCT